jgi:hypothetical protein
VAEVAAPEIVEVVETAALEAAEVTSAAAPPAEEEEPEVLLGRPLLLSAAEIPSPGSWPNASRLKRSWRLAFPESGRSRMRSTSGSPTGSAAWGTASCPPPPGTLKSAPSSCWSASSCKSNCRRLAVEEKMLAATEKEQAALELAN